MLISLAALTLSRFVAPIDGQMFRERTEAHNLQALISTDGKSLEGSFLYHNHPVDPGSWKISYFVNRSLFDVADFDPADGNWKAIVPEAQGALGDKIQFTFKVSETGTVGLLAVIIEDSFGDASRKRHEWIILSDDYPTRLRTLKKGPGSVVPITYVDSDPSLPRTRDSVSLLHSAPLVEDSQLDFLEMEHPFDPQSHALKFFQIPTSAGVTLSPGGTEKWMPVILPPLLAMQTEILPLRFPVPKKTFVMTLCVDAFDLTDQRQTELGGVIHEF